MKKLFTLISLVALCALSAMAAIGNSPVLKTDKNFDWIPAEYCEGGKSAVLYAETSEDYNYETTPTIEFSIFDNKMNVVRSFSTINMEHKDVVKRYTNLRGITVTPLPDSEQYGNLRYDNIPLEAAKEMMKDMGYSYVQADGKNLFYPDNEYDYLYFDRFGKKYPRNCYYLNENGQLWEYYNIRYDVTGDITDQWILESTEYEDNYSSICSIYPKMAAYPGVEMDDFEISQTLFNDDDKFEYLVYEYTPYTEEYIRDEEIYTDGGSIMYKEKTVREGRKRTGIRVMSENGSELAHISVESGYELESGVSLIDFGDDDQYLVLNCYKRGEEGLESEYVDFIYSLNSSTNGTLQMACEPIRTTVRPNVAKASTPVTVSFGGEGKSARKIVVTSADGRVAMTKSVEAGATSATIDTSSLAQGMYIVTVAEEGRSTENCKIIIR